MANKHLILLKLLLFTYFGGTSCIFPYLAVHMRQIGISVQETAVIHALLPIAMFIGPPISGFVADKFGGHKIILIVCLTLTSLFHTSLLLVPQVHRGAHLEDGAHLSCDSNGRNLTVSFAVPNDDCSATETTRASFTLCRKLCPTDLYTDLNIESNKTRTHTSGVASLCQVIPLIKSAEEPNENDDGNVQTCISYDRTTRHFDFLTIDVTGNGHSEELVRFQPLEKNVHESCSFLSNSYNSCAISCSQRSSEYERLNAPQCGNNSKTFWVYLVLRVVASIFMSSCFTLFDAITMVVVKEHGTDYGKQRIWPILATAVFPPVTGFLVDYLSTDDGIASSADYRPPFFMMDALLFCTLLLSLLLKVNVTLSSDTNLKSIGRLVKNPRIDTLVISLFVLGTMWGYVEVFLYWYLLELGSPRYLLGLTLTVGSGIGVPVLFFSEKIIRMLGHVTIMFVAFLFYTIRYVGYSFIYNPWWCLIFEAMEIFTLHLMWVAVVTYTTRLVPKGLLATTQGLIGGTHYGIGRGSGSLIGGLLMGYIGARNTFRYMGMGSAIAGILFLFVERVLLRRVPIDCEETKENTDDHKMKNVDNNKTTSNSEQNANKI